METWINEVIFLPIYYLRLKWCQNSQEKQVWVAPTFQRRKSKGKSYPSKTGADDSTGSIPTAKSVMNWFCLCDARLSLLGVWAFIREGGEGPYHLPRQPNPEGSVRLAPFTFKSSNLLLRCKSHTGLVTTVISDSSQDVLVPYLDLSDYQVWSWLATISYAILFSTEASIWGKIWWVWKKRGRGKIYPFFPLVVTF